MKVAIICCCAHFKTKERDQNEESLFIYNLGRKETKKAMSITKFNKWETLFRKLDINEGVIYIYI